MRSVVKTGKTVDEAVHAALEALDATLDDVTIDIMEEAKPGFLGMFGGKDAIVRVTRKETGFRSLLEEEGLLSSAEKHSQKEISPSETSEQAPSDQEQPGRVDDLDQNAVKETNVQTSIDEPVIVEGSASEPRVEESVEEDTVEEATEEDTKESSVEDAVLSDDEAQILHHDIHPSEPNLSSVSSDAVQNEQVTEDVQPIPRASDASVSAFVNAPSNVTKQDEDTDSQNSPHDANLEEDDTHLPGESQHRPSLQDLIHQQLGESETASSMYQEKVDSDETVLDPPSHAAQTEEDHLSVLSSSVSESSDFDKEELSSGASDDEKENFVFDWLSQTLKLMHISAEIQVHTEEGDLYAELVNMSDTDMGIAIGRRAETLNALQYLLGVSIHRAFHSHTRIYLDIGGYRARRMQNIERLAHRTADKVIRYKKQVSLEPMNAFERRIVHTTLQNVEHIETISEGREPHRKVVVLYKY